MMEQLGSQYLVVCRNCSNLPTENDRIKRIISRTAKKGNLTVEENYFRRYNQNNLVSALIISESHIITRIDYRKKAVLLDVFTCKFLKGGKILHEIEAIDYFCNQIGVTEKSIKLIERGVVHAEDKKEFLFSNLEQTLFDYEVIDGERDKASPYFGTHRIIEAYDCNSEKLKKHQDVAKVFNDAASIGGLMARDGGFKQFELEGEPHGVSGLLFGPGAHITIHTWPEKGYFSFDVFAIDPIYKNLTNMINHVMREFKTKTFYAYSAIRDRKQIITKG